MIAFYCYLLLNSICRVFPRIELSVVSPARSLLGAILHRPAIFPYLLAKQPAATVGKSRRQNPAPAEPHHHGYHLVLLVRREQDRHAVHL